MKSKPIDGTRKLAREHQEVRSKNEPLIVEPSTPRSQDPDAVISNDHAPLEHRGIFVPEVDAIGRGPQRAPKVRGCTIISNGASAAAVAEAARILNAMIYDDELVKWCERENVCFHIAPKGTKLTDLEDFKDLRGKPCITGELYDTCLGVHRPQKVNGRHVLVTKEEELLRAVADRTTDNVGLHEVAHLVHHYGEETGKPWASELSRVFARAKNFTTEYSKKNRWEFFAEHSESAWGCAGTFRQKNIKDVYAAEPGLFAVMCEAYFALSDQMTTSAFERGQKLPLTHLGGLFSQDGAGWMSADAADRKLKQLGFKREGDTYEWRPEGSRVSQIVELDRFAIAPGTADQIRLITRTPDREQTLTLDYAGNFTRTAVTNPGAAKKSETLADQLTRPRPRIELDQQGGARVPFTRGFRGTSLDDELMAGLGPHLLAPEIRRALEEAKVSLDAVLMSVGQIEKMNPQGGWKLAEELAQHGYVHLYGGTHDDRSVLLKPLSADGRTYLRLSYEGYGEHHRVYSMAIAAEIVTARGAQKWIDSLGGYEIAPPGPIPFQMMNPLLLKSAPEEFRAEIRQWINSSAGAIRAEVPANIRGLLEDPTQLFGDGKSWMDPRAIMAALKNLGFKSLPGRRDDVDLELNGDGWSAKVKLGIDRSGPNGGGVGRIELSVTSGEVTEVRRLEAAGELDAYALRGDPAKIPLLERRVAGLYGQDDPYRRALLQEALRQELVLEARLGPGRAGIVEALTEQGVKIAGLAEPVAIGSLESLRLRGGSVDAEALRRALAGEAAKRDLFGPLEAALKGRGEPEAIRAVAAGEPIDLTTEKGRALLLGIAERVKEPALRALLEVAPGFKLDTPLDAKGTTLLHAVLIAGDRARGAYEHENLIFALLDAGASGGAVFEHEGEKIDALAAAVLKAAKSFALVRTDALAQMINHGAKLDGMLQGKPVWQHLLDARGQLPIDFFRSVMTQRAKVDPQLAQKISEVAVEKDLKPVRDFLRAR